ncbi:BRO-N domain-containing protein [Pseudomonas nitroreducens]|uniref:BRO-N domain-containing protein n=1 Tax=Pseudomonas nitroreducens TaxID=46680 RepID=UPI002658D41B|nr:BRO family protein [Pseudomonas nitroreducens]MCP1647176.1 prophage antirepressor-like protein [Pseudomonas nitroreducens]MCP1685752.1 prophage antirepressor-like protein [Pseudomonas nitroreducens]
MSMDAFTATAQFASPLVPTLFYRHKRRLRALLIEGQPWFVVHDLAKLMHAFLEERVGNNLDADQVCRRMILNDHGLAEELELISESGLYASLIYFYHPENRCIRQWITQTVVPSLRANEQTLDEQPRRRLLRWERQQLSVLDWQGQVWVPLPELPQALHLG